MELSAGAALFAALIVLFGGLALIGWIVDTVQKWHDKRCPRPKKRSLSITDFPISDNPKYYGSERHPKDN